MPLSSRQQEALARAKGPEKARLRAAFKAQNPRLHAGRASKGKRSTAPKPGKTDKLPTAGDLFDPRNGMLVPVVVSEGLAFPATDKAIDEISVGTTEKVLIFMTNAGHTSTVASVVKFDSTTVISKDIMNCPMVRDTNATYMRAMKGGLGLLNVTQQLNVGGRVFVGHFNQRISLPATWATLTASQFNDIAADIKNNPDTRPYSANEFAAGEHRWVTHPSNQINYLDYLPYVSTVSGDTFATVWGTQGTLASRPMSIVVVLLESPPVAQSYQLTVDAAWYARYPLTNLMSRAMKPVPTRDASWINKMRDFAEHMKDTARKGVRNVGRFLRDDVVKPFSRGAGQFAIGYGISRAIAAAPLALTM